MNPGKIDRRIMIQKRVLSKDATGTRVETWVDEEKRTWAELVKQTGKESNPNDAERSIDNQQLRIRFRTLNTTDYRIKYTPKTATSPQFYNITGITEEQGRSVSLLLDTVATQSLS